LKGSGIELLGGFMSRILRVNLTDSKIFDEPLKESMARKYIGSYGIGARILYDEVEPNTDPFNENNRLIFCTGPVTGTIAPTAGRFSVVFKSPMTGFYGDANSGGYWGPELKFAGYDFIIFQGRSDKPVYVFIHDGEAEIKDASYLWGSDARATDEMIRKDLGDARIKVASIGQAGENLVRFAAIQTDNADRSAARCGGGAVMGSKNLKAVAVRGNMRVPVAHEEELRKLTREILEYSKESKATQKYRAGGTPTIINAQIGIGYTPSYNWTSDTGDFPGVEKIAALPGGYDRILTGNRSCYNCPVGCRRIVKVESGPYKCEGEGPEYETLGCLGSNCGINDIEVIAKANDLCNTYGMDTISCGGTIAFAMECYEKGLITKQDTGGIELRFGNGAALIETIEKISKRTGIGNVLAEGSKRAAEAIGKGAEQFAIQVKGMELSATDPRAFQGGGLHFATTVTGGRHGEGLTLGVEQGFGAPDLGLPGGMNRFETTGRGELAKVMQDWFQVFNAMGYCWFNYCDYKSRDVQLHVYAAVTGLSMTVKDSLKIGERIFNLKKAFNVRHGSTVRDDRLPERFLKEPKKKGGCAGVVVKLDEMLPQYYAARGWDPKLSMPTKERLIELDLKDVAEDLWK
jgi:aldehyde:ferredoxin oxidoreductase